MRGHRVLHFAGRDPHPRALEEVVGAALEPVEPLLVAPVDVAGLHPAVPDQLGGLLRLVEIVRNRAAALYVQGAATGALDDLLLIIKQAYFIAFEHDARAAGAVAVREIVDE